MFCPETLELLNKERTRLSDKGLPERNALFNILNPCISNAEQRRRDFNQTKPFRIVHGKTITHKGITLPVVAEDL